MKQDRDGAFNELIDIIDGSQVMGDDDLRSFLNSEEGRAALHDFQIIDGAIERKYGTRVNPDAAWSRMSFNQTNRRHSKARAVVLILSTVAAVALLLWILVPSIPVSRPGGEVKVAEASPKAAVSRPAAGKTGRTASVQVEKQSVDITTVRTLERETRHLQLSDGSEVWLNARSALSYPLRFSSSERTVTLRGEAYFKIAHDSQHPFVITSGNLQTKVLGTEFNVRCYNDHDAHVTLVRGSVEVSAGKSIVCIKPGEDAHVSEESITVMPVNTKDYVSWRTGTMYFDNATLRAILNEMGNWYGVNVVCNDKGLLDKHFHFMYSHSLPIENALSLLNDASDINVSFENNTIVIK